jgi:DNA-binding CsgD family transcriptional regulator
MRLLTPQELQLALIVGRGATNKEASAALFISPKTVEAHLHHICVKLSIRSRTELARLLAREQMLDWEPRRTKQTPQPRQPEARNATPPTPGLQHGLHETRAHVRVALIAAGVNAKAITTYLGQASIQTTYDLYGKLMPGSDSEAAAPVDA